MANRDGMVLSGGDEEVQARHVPAEKVAFVENENALEEAPAPIREYSLGEKLAAELVGTFFLALAVATGVASQSLMAPAAIGLVLAVQIYTFGAVSGGMFNPAVTLAVLLSGRDKMRWSHAGLYMLTQITGACIGAFCALAAHGHTFYFGLSKGHSTLGCWTLEIFFTMALCNIVLVAGTSSKDTPNQYFGFAIGFTVMAAAWAVGGWDQGSFNPAVTIGINMANLAKGVATQPRTSSWFLFTMGPCLGGGLAAAVFHMTRSYEYHDEEDDVPLAGPKRHEPLVAEFVGTFVLVLTVGTSVPGHGPLAAIAIGIMLASQVYTFASVSGAHLNPAVTVSVLLAGRRKIAPVQAVMYMATQTLAAVAAGLVAFYATDTSFSFDPERTGKTENPVLTSVLLETCFTLALCHCVLAVATTKEPPNQYFGFAIGATVIGGALVSGGNIDQGSYNPAVTVGINFANWLNPAATDASTLKGTAIFVVAPLIGAVVAPMIFYRTRHQEYERERVTLPEQMFCEFVGTFYLTLSATVCIGGAVLLVPVAVGLMLAVQIYSFGSVSGAHLNPAVSLAVMLTGRDKISPPHAAAYMVAQSCGSILAAVTSLYTTGHSFAFEARQVNAHHICWGLEIVFTMALCLVVLTVATSKDAPNQYFGFAIGCAVIGGVMTVSGHMDLGSYNPAITLGVNVANYMNQRPGIVSPDLHSWLLFLFAPMIGGILAATVFRFTRSEEFGVEERTPLREKMIAEMMGTFFLVFTVGVSVTSGVKFAAVAIGLNLAVQIYTWASVSGAHLNPAVTLSILASGRDKISTTESVVYAIMQLLGGVIGAIIAYGVTGSTFFFQADRAGLNLVKNFLLEGVFTTMLCSIVLAAATSRDAGNAYYGFAIGGAVIGGALDVTSFDQGAFNPAVTIGINIAHHANDAAEDHPHLRSWALYILTPLLGGILAALLFRIIRAPEFEEDEKESADEESE